MSHLKLRPENDCLNCGTEVNGRFCSNCGQENLELNVSAWHLIVHFFNDFTHFDGKFFSTLGKLIKKPGFLSTEYMLGRRKRYLDPVRMYIFTSFVFFLIFYNFSSYNPEAVKIKFDGRSSEEIAKMDSLEFDKFTKQLNKGIAMSRAEYLHYTDSVNQINALDAFFDYKSREEYDSLLSSGSLKHGWLDRKMTYQQFSLKEKYNNDRNAVIKDFWDRFIHSFPQLFFLSLPLYALCLKLMYRRSKAYTYVYHSIFSVHIYIISFIAGLLAMFFSWLDSVFEWDTLILLNGILLIGLCIYEFIAMRKFYKQGMMKTFIKYCILNVMRFIIMILLTIMIIFVIFLNG